jgi:hypothetical protein
MRWLINKKLMQRLVGSRKEAHPQIQLQSHE